MYFIVSQKFETLPNLIGPEISFNQNFQRGKTVNKGSFVFNINCVSCRLTDIAVFACPAWFTVALVAIDLVQTVSIHTGVAQTLINV